jgi:hypothetical protein
LRKKNCKKFGLPQNERKTKKPSVNTKGTQKIRINNSFQIFYYKELYMSDKLFLFFGHFYFWEFLDLKKYLIFDLFKGFLNEKKDPN